jgi:hypothetical protein
LSIWCCLGNSGVGSSASSQSMTGEERVVHGKDEQENHGALPRH